MSEIVRRSNAEPATQAGSQPAESPKKSPVPCWLLLRKHRFDGPQEYQPGRKLTMKRRCSACGQLVTGGQILFKEEE